MIKSWILKWLGIGDALELAGSVKERLATLESHHNKLAEAYEHTASLVKSGEAMCEALQSGWREHEDKLAKIQKAIDSVVTVYDEQFRVLQKVALGKGGVND